MTELHSYAFYGLMAAVCLLLAWYSERSGKKRGLVLCAVLLTVVAGLRSYEVGIDTLPYKEGIEFFYENGRTSWLTRFSYGYGVFTSFLYSLIHSYSFVLLIQAAITNGMILARFWDYREACSISFMLLVYMSTSYFVSLCITCQYVAIALVFYGSRYADKGKPIVYCAFILIAGLIHTSALITFADVVLRYFRLKGSSPIGFLIRLAAVIVSPVCIYFTWRVFVDRYASYADNFSSIGLMVPTQILIFLLALLCSAYFSKKTNANIPSLKKELSSRAPYAVREYSLGLILSASSYVIANAGRIAYYFTVYGSVCFGAIAKHSSESKGRLACSIVLFGWFIGYCIYANFINGSLGIVPYSFIWG